MLESANGPVPSLAAAITGEPIRGSWWGHPRSHEIFAATRAVRESREILVCRLVNGKVTFVHRKLWPALVRAGDRFPRGRVAQICERHTSTGRHIAQEVPFPTWIPPGVREAAGHLTESEALCRLGPWTVALR